MEFHHDAGVIEEHLQEGKPFNHIVPISHLSGKPLQYSRRLWGVAVKF